MAANLEMYLYRLKCINENDFGFGSDEPYVMVWVGEKPRLRPDIQQPISLVTLYGIWEDVDDGEEVYTVEIPDLSNMPDLIMKLFLEMWYNSIKDMHQDRRRFWGVNELPQLIRNYEDVIILVAMMEKGSINPQFIVTYLQPLMLVQLNYYLTQGLNHDEMVRRLRDDMAGFLSPADLDLVFDGTNDLIGPVRELLTREEFARLEKAEVGTRLRKRLSFSSSGTYQLDFIIKKHLFLQRPPRPLVRPQ